LVITPGARAALDELKHEGFLPIVTNPTDVARGKASAADVDKINTGSQTFCRLMLSRNASTTIEQRRDCRKPKPGMILRALKKFGWM
jgi:histidinol phosphatase-like enzyme